WAIDPFSIKYIRVEGLQRSDPGTVFAALPFRVGDLYNEEKGAAAVRALFATGLFKDVRPGCRWNRRQGRSGHAGHQGVQAVRRFK
ncbi:MAG: hypothetical protein ACKOCU_08060, partial [Betaproteobacteria bacterium]